MDCSSNTGRTFGAELGIEEYPSVRVFRSGDMNEYFGPGPTAFLPTYSAGSGSSGSSAERIRAEADSVFNFLVSDAETAVIIANSPSQYVTILSELEAQRQTKGVAYIVGYFPAFLFSKDVSSMTGDYNKNPLVQFKLVASHLRG